LDQPARLEPRERAVQRARAEVNAGELLDVGGDCVAVLGTVGQARHHEQPRVSRSLPDVSLNVIVGGVSSRLSSASFAPLDDPFSPNGDSLALCASECPFTARGAAS